MAETKKVSKVKKPSVKADSKPSKVVAEQDNEALKDEPDALMDVESNEATSDTPDDNDAEVKTLAKAGKRSAKAVKEVEDKEVKQAKKTLKSDEKTEESKKPSQKAPRSRAERAGKKYREALKLIEPGKVYSLKEALELATKTSPAKFDATVELHFNLGVDPKQADQNIRGMVALPAGTGKLLNIAVLCEPADEPKAKAAGAIIVGADAVFAALDKGQIAFDVLIAAPTLMAKLGKYAKLLGPRGLMPNPKSGTVNADVVKAITEALAGRVEYRVDEAGIVHLAVGKVSFGGEKLQQNAEVIVSSLKAAKPASLKGVYIKSGFVTTTMGPSIKISLE